MIDTMKKILFLGASLLTVCAILSSCRKEPKVDPNKPSIAWEENSGFATIEIIDGMKAPITVTAPQGLDVLTLTANAVPTALLATANNLIGTSANKGDKPLFDLIDDAGLAATVGKLGFPTGTSLRGRTTGVSFDLARLVNGIIGGNEILVKNNDSFEFEIRVRDTAGNEMKKTARFHNTSAPELKAEPAELDLVNDGACSVTVKAEGKIKDLTLTFETPSAGIRSFIAKRCSSTATNPVVDLVGDEKAVTAFADLGLPTGSKVTGKELKLDFSKLLSQLKMEVEQNASSTHKITVAATDENGKKGYASVTLRFIAR